MRYLLISLLILLGGCTTSSEEIEASILACKDRGGIYYLNHPSGNVYSVRCKNGTLISGPIKP